MLTMTAGALEKQAQHFMDSLNHAQFKIDGALQDQIPIWKKEQTGQIIRIYLMIGYEYEGLITDVKIIDQNGAVVIESPEQWVKPEERGIYITFKYQYLEREAEAVERVYKGDLGGCHCR